MQLIGFTGFAGSGKDTAARLLIEQHGFQNLKMAAGLKYMTYSFLNFVGCPADEAARLVDGTKEQKETPSEYFMGHTSRWFQQSIGTEWGRNCMGEDFWVWAFTQKAKGLEKVVCTDVRFPNEVEAIHKLGGRVYRVHRSSTYPKGDLKDLHPSEKFIPELDVDGVLMNDGSIQELEDWVQKMYTSIY